MEKTFSRKDFIAELNPKIVDRKGTEEGLKKIIGNENLKFVWVANPLEIAYINELQKTTERLYSELRAGPFDIRLKVKFNEKELYQEVLNGLSKLSGTNITRLRSYMKLIKQYTGKVLNLKEGTYTKIHVPYMNRYSCINKELEEHSSKISMSECNANWYINSIEKILKKFKNVHLQLEQDHFIRLTENEYTRILKIYFNNRNGVPFIGEREVFKDLEQEVQTVALNTSYITTFDELVVLCPHPLRNEVLDKEEHVIENLKKPVLEYSGLQIYSIEGFVFPKNVITRPKTQNIDDILNETNLEKRRIRINRYGWKNLIEDSLAIVQDKVVTAENNVEFLVRIKKTQDEYSYRDIVILCTADPSTGRPYFLQVGQRCNTCDEAQEYLRGTDREILEPLNLPGIITTTFKKGHAKIRA